MKPLTVSGGDEVRGLRDALEAAQGELMRVRRALEAATGAAAEARAEVQQREAELQHLEVRVRQLEEGAATAWAAQRRDEAQWPALPVSCRRFQRFDQAAAFASSLPGGALRTITWDAAQGVVGVWSVVGVKGPPREAKCEVFTAPDVRTAEVHEQAARFLSRLAPEALVAVNSLSEPTTAYLAVWYFPPS